MPLDRGPFVCMQLSQKCSKNCPYRCTPAVFSVSDIKNPFGPLIMSIHQSNREVINSVTRIDAMSKFLIQNGFFGCPKLRSCGPRLNLKERFKGSLSSWTLMHPCKHPKGIHFELAGNKTFQKQHKYDLLKRRGKWAEEAWGRDIRRPALGQSDWQLIKRRTWRVCYIRTVYSVQTTSTLHVKHWSCFACAIVDKWRKTS